VDLVAGDRGLEVEQCLDIAAHAGTSLIFILIDGMPEGIP
jgi:hypothetical protein